MRQTETKWWTRTVADQCGGLEHLELSNAKVRAGSFRWENPKPEIIKDFWIRRFPSKELNGCLLDFENSKKRQNFNHK